MHRSGGCSIAIVLALFFFCHACAVAQQSLRSNSSADAYSSLRADWHLAALSEYESEWSVAIRYYRQAIEDCRILPLEAREWYVGTAHYGIARSLSRENESSTTVRKELTQAFQHHFWNFELIGEDSITLAKCGFPWLDSCSIYWTDVAQDERALWREQVPLVFYPNGYDSTFHLPLVIALHGGNGNYQSFAEHWLGMADKLHAVIVIPAGIIRESQITNSWGSNMDTIAPMVLALVNHYVGCHHVDPSQIYLIGFSQGAQASIELTLLYPNLFQGAIAISGFVDRPLSDSLLRKAHTYGAKIYEITGQFEDPTFFREIDSIHARCDAVGIPFKMNISPGMVHEVPLDFNSQVMAGWNWLRSTDADQSRENQ